MNAPSDPHAGSEPSPPYPGHPFGGLIRDGGAGMRAVDPRDDNARRDERAAEEESGGFDFHLGVYARF
ncbi:hypothetical protein [Hyphomicrobium sp. NDB2Meth4]|uniref:hypothetical protein n=1 Tax=Hyphomicrobium sp. NDB2Meth4 TaxID=1892846 RepID=UPI00093021B0|nr:hypothetical protein [Hyphomicrobium sp. NDB2Meth4]